MPGSPRYGIIAFAFCFTCLAGTAAGADLHFFLLCDTLDPSIGTPTDLVNAQAWAQTIADNTGLTLRMNALYGTNLTAANAKAALNTVQPAEDDTVFFLYSGHGGNPGSLKWPIFYFLSDPNTMPDEQRLSFDQVVQILRPKNPRLLFILADACNSFPNQSGHWPPTAPVPTDPAVTQAFIDLFVGFRGEVLTSASKPGQYSIGAEGEGALYYNNVVSAIYELAWTQSSVTWEAVLAKAAADTTAAAATYGNPQEPQYEIRAGVVADGQPPTSTDSGSNTTPLSAPIPLCGWMGMLPLAACATGLSLMRLRTRVRSLSR